MLRVDPPDHTRLRSLVSKAFTPRAVEALQPRIQTIADDLLDAVPTDAPFDLMQAFANHLPVIVIAEMLGVPAADREQFKTWSTDLILGAGAFRSPDARARREAARAQLLAYFERVVQERRQQPRDDLISALIKAEEEDDRLSEAELLDTWRVRGMRGGDYRADSDEEEEEGADRLGNDRRPHPAQHRASPIIRCVGDCRVAQGCAVSSSRRRSLVASSCAHRGGNLAPPEGIEPPTQALGRPRSIR